MHNVYTLIKQQTICNDQGQIQNLAIFLSGVQNT